MKNHIKNYIKIMGLAAVLFGTAQATDYEIKVTQEHKPEAMHFRISVSRNGATPHLADIEWQYNKEYPNTLFYPDMFMRCYDDETKRENRFQNHMALTEYTIQRYATFFERFKNFYDVSELNGNQLQKVIGSEITANAVLRNYTVEFLKNKNLTLDNFIQRWKNYDLQRRFVSCFIPERGHNIVKYCLPKGCIVAHYWCEGVNFYIFKDKQRSLGGPEYVLVFRCGYGYIESLRCSSNVPTVGCGIARDVYSSDNEILSPSFRERILSTLAYEEFFWGRCFIYRGGCKFNADVYAENCASVLKFDYLVKQDSNGKAIRARKRQKSGDTERFEPLDLKCLPGDIKCGR